MIKSLYLTADERKAYDALSDDLKEGWTVEEEGLDCYESDRQLRMRAHMADFSMYPEVESIVNQVTGDGEPAPVSLDGISPDVQKELYFMIGARGVKILVTLLFKELKNDDDIEALAFLTTVRHELLETNSKAVFS